jgi:hypothetical protein
VEFEMQSQESEIRSQDPESEINKQTSTKERR